MAASEAEDKELGEERPALGAEGETKSLLSKDDNEREQAESNHGEVSTGKPPSGKRSLKMDRQGKEAQKDTSDTTIDLSRHKPKYNTKSKSSMTNVLTEYGFPEDKTVKQKSKKRQEKRKKSPKMRREQTFDSMASDEQEKMTPAKREKYIQVYKDVHKLRDYYYDEYLSQLRDKIDRQKDEMQKKSTATEKKMRDREEKEQNERAKHARKRMQRVDMKDNSDFLKTIPKSDVYKIVSLQQKLMVEGKLKSSVDVDNFWDNIRRPEIFNQCFPDDQSIPDSSSHYSSGVFASGRSRTSSMSSVEKGSQAQQSDKLDYRPMTQIEETIESSRPPTRDKDDWAVTQMAPAVHKQAPVAKKPSDPYTIARLAAVELDKKYPGLELPQLSCLSAEMSDDALAAEQLLKEQEKERREKERRLFIMRLRRMYHLTQSNQASAQRILEKHADEMDLAINGPPLSALMELSVLHSGYDDDDDRDPYGQRPWLRHVLKKKRDIGTIDEMPEETTARSPSGSVRFSSGMTKSRSSRRKSAQKPVTPPPALNLDSLEHVAPIVEAKSLSTMWTNYERIGFHGHLSKIKT